MFQQSSSRNQRTKGSKIRTLVKVSILLGVAIWLLYQIKQSHDKKAEVSAAYEEKLSNGDGNEYLGRKGKAGSENVIIIETQDGNLDELSETKERDGGQADPGNWGTEENNGQEALNKEQDDSQDIFSNTGDKESSQDKQENEDENADSRNNSDHEATDKGESEERESQAGITSNSNESQQEQLGNENGIADTQVNDSDQAEDKSASEGNGEVLRLPSQGESDSSFDQNENTKEVEDNGAKSDTDEANNISSSANQGEIGENAVHNSESSDTVVDNATSGAAVSTDSSLPEDQSNTEGSTNNEVQEKEAVESTEGDDSISETTSTNPVEEAMTDSRSGNGEQNIAASNNNEALEKDIVEPQRDSTVEAETTENHTSETTNSDAKSEDEIANPSNENASGNSSSEEENTSNLSLSSEGAKLDDTKVEKMESQGDGASAENTDNSAAEVKTETSEDIVDSSQADKQSDLQVSADKLPDREEVESRGDSASEAENANDDIAQTDVVKTDSNSNSETNPELVDNVDVSSGGAAAEGGN